LKLQQSSYRSMIIRKLRLKNGYKRFHDLTKKQVDPHLI